MSVTVEILDALVDCGGGPSHCALIPAALINGHHFSTSALWKAPNAAGVCNSRGGGSTPWSSRRWRVAASDWAASPAALSLATGSPWGPTSPSRKGQSVRAVRIPLWSARQELRTSDDQKTPHRP